MQHFFGIQNSFVRIELYFGKLFLENDINGEDYYNERRKFGGAIILGNFNTQLFFSECIFKKHFAKVNLKIIIKD